MPYKRLSTYSHRLTLVLGSPIRGLTHRQWKDCRAWIGRRAVPPATKKAWLNNAMLMHRLAAVVSPRKHYWS